MAGHCVKKYRSLLAGWNLYRHILVRLDDGQTSRRASTAVHGSRWVIDHVEDGAERMWHAMGHPDTDGEGDRTDEIRAVKDAMLTASREEFSGRVHVRGTDPTVVDDVLRRLDVRGTQPSSRRLHA